MGKAPAFEKRFLDYALSNLHVHRSDGRPTAASAF
jgi:hypothetical protein